MRIGNTGVFGLAAFGLLAACGGGDSDSASGGAGGGGPAGGEGGVVLGDGSVGGVQGDGGPGGTAGGAGGDGGGGGEGGTPSMERPVEERCPDLQAGNYLLIAFPDRVDAYRQREFGASFFCTFLDLSGNGITNAGGFARSSDEGGPFYVTSTSGGRGFVHSFDANGRFIERVTSNVNLADVDGLWSKFSGDGFIAWSKGNSNFYELDPDGGFVGTWTPPLAMSSRLDNLTDLFFVDAESMMATFSNRPPKLFKHPFSPDFDMEQVGAANAVTGIPTEEGTKLLITGEAGGAGNGFGVLLYKAVVSGRQPPELETVLVQPGEFTDGVALLALDSGFLLLDSALGGSARLVIFDHAGVLQNEIGLEGDGSPIRMMFANVFPDF